MSEYRKMVHNTSLHAATIAPASVKRTYDKHSSSSKIGETLFRGNTEVLESKEYHAKLLEVKKVAGIIKDNRQQAIDRRWAKHRNEKKS